MQLMQRSWASFAHLLSIATLSPFGDFRDEGVQQTPLLGEETARFSGYGGPVFRPPGHRVEGPGSEFQCDYSRMGADWIKCSHEYDRACWLKNTKTGEKFDIHTNYENFAPLGIQRNYTLIVNNGSINADGMLFPEAKLFNATYPGPWLQACWGDVVQVNVINKLPYNGTSIHWHGIRQNQTMHMDGVNGITQCPIAPGDSFVYKWNVTQYGSSWYHSHYSVQYADGLVGPMTLHGPSSANFTEAVDIPTLLTDWGHNSAFEALYVKLKNPTILLNGKGDIEKYTGGLTVAQLPIPEPYTLVFSNSTDKQGKPKKYLLRLINTSFDTTFVFSIDNHNLTIIGADFVPIHPYSNTSVLVGIGQRYHVVVEAKPIANGTSQRIPDDHNFWMRTYVAGPGCMGKPGKGHYEETGILRYNSSSKALPQSQAWYNMSMACSDETYSSLVPILPWKIGNPANAGQEHDVVVDVKANRTENGPFGIFSLEPTTFGSKNIPLRIDFGDPTFLHLNKTGSDWPKKWIVVPENYTDKDWVYLVIAGDRKSSYESAGAHPIHLHGHDFALLQQAEGTKLDYGSLNLKFDNPPRRDVVLLPRNGFVVIAFKTDNPGSWLMHCHIATHAAMGLAMQVLERQKAADDIWPWATSHAIAAARQTCRKWDDWHGNCDNWWPGDKGGCERNRTEPAFAFQDDSGI
ncbi:multicopper oxidase-domain-containing protein [Apodospora peruviana]|uniref:Multicopper oxidase-domain-containing protein n=1 Tax=Apodospora peruviana TaxID=516989 RepID=A0AAE0M0L4_9PEZI|nr:multicopper oxidase-domain-containing protein [Apodospora peruviana]